MFDRNPAYFALSIEVKKGILIQISRLGHVGAAELDVERISVFEVTKFHSRNERSKNALCTVSPSGSSITRK